MPMPTTSQVFSTVKPPAYAELKVEEVEDITEVLYDDIHEDFLSEVSSIQGLITQLRGSIVSLGKLRARRYSLFLEPEPADDDGACTDDVVQRIALLVAEVDARLQAFGSSRGAKVLQATPEQAALLRARFLDALRAYHAVERDARMRLRARIARQFRVAQRDPLSLPAVHPDATLSDVRRAAEGRPAQGLLRADLRKSRRYGEGRKALQEVQERQAELAQLERSLEELNVIIERVSAEVERDNLSQAPRRRAVPPVPAGAGKDIKMESDAALVDAEEPDRERRRRCGMCGLVLVLVFSAIVGILVVSGIVAANVFGH